jgi:hypothetical protein
MAEGVDLRSLRTPSAFPALHFAVQITGQSTASDVREIMRYARTAYRCDWPANGGGPIVFEKYSYAISYFFLSEQPITGHLVTVWFDDKDVAIRWNAALDSAYYVPDLTSCHRI